MTLFGTAGNSKSFYAAGYTASVQAPEYNASLGLTAYEYEAGYGVQIGERTARAIGEAAARHGISVSIHAPYYINCATMKPDHRERNFKYLLDSARAVKWMGGDRVIFHPGSEKGGHEEAMRRAEEFIGECLDKMRDAGLDDIHLCPETMGKVNTLGTPEDIVRLCRIDASMIPTIDYAHLHARYKGALDSVQAFDEYTCRVLRGIWPQFGEAGADLTEMPYRIRHFHVHFSHVEYYAGGERRHRRFDEEGFGPDFRMLIPVLRKYGLEPVIICESAGTQAEDAVSMMHMLSFGQ